MKAYVVCLSWNLLFHSCWSVFTISRSLDKQLIYCAASRYPPSLHLNVARGARQFSLSTFCLWISRDVAESARKLVKYANCPDNSVKIEFFVYSSNRILSHDASTFARRSSKGFVAILLNVRNVISLILTPRAWNLYL